MRGRSSSRVRRTIGLLVPVVLVAFGTGVTGALASPVVTVRDGPLRFGTFDLRPCPLVEVAQYRSWCGRALRPTVPGATATGEQTLSIRFAVILPVGTKAGGVRTLQDAGALVGLEGGPGYGATGNAYAYTDIFDPLLSDRALVLMDARGTGRSGAIDCPSLDDPDLSAGESIAACGSSLGTAIAGYGTSAAMADLAAIVQGLGFRQADVYGGSYGTFAAQVLANEHPDLVRSLVLDGAYPVAGETAWYPTQGPALVQALNFLCSQDRTCQTQATTTSEVLTSVLAQVRAKPVTVRAPGDDGRRHSVVVDPSALVEVAFGATYGTATYREFDPALRAFLAGDPLPLGRLVAEERFPGGPEQTAEENSGGQFLAVSCQDYPQLFDMAADPQVRTAQRDAAVAAAVQETPNLYAPFTIAEYLDSAWATQDLCRNWPQLTPGSFGPPVKNPYPDVPTLVLSGNLDTITTAAEGSMVAKQFPRSLHVVVPNGAHVQALGVAEGCTADLVRDFVTSPQEVLQNSPPACQGPKPRLTSTYLGTARARGVPEATAITIADTLNRWRKSAGYTGLGLRSGTWRGRLQGQSGYRITLTDVRVFPDLPVTGTIVWRFGGKLQADVSVPGGQLRLTWNSLTDGAQAEVDGWLDGKQVTSRFPAP